MESLESRDLLSSSALSPAVAAFGFGGQGGGFANVTYHGGPLLQNVQIQAVFDGSAWSTDSSLQQQAQQTDAFLQYFVTSPYIDVLKQYNVSDGTFAGNDFVAQDPGQTISDSQIQSILQSEISSGTVGAPTANSLYIFFAPPGTVVTDGSQNSVRDFAGYHSVFTDSAGTSVYYAVIPYPTGNVANVPLTTFQQETVVLSHEISEGMTDPDTQTGWFDPRLGEIGDIAEGQVGQLGNYEVQAIWSQAADLVVLPGSTTTNSNVEVTGVPVKATAGQAFTGIVATIAGADPSATTGSFTATINWGNGNTTNGTITTDRNGGFDISGTNTYAQAGPYTITVSVSDSSGAAVGTATSKAFVAPAETIEARGLVFDATAGTAFTGNVATFTSSNSSATTGTFSATINWGDGTTSNGTIVLNPSGGFAVQGTHTYANATSSGQGLLWSDGFQGPFGDHGYVVVVTITDTQDNSGETAISLAKVAPAPSTIMATGQNITAVSGQSFTGAVATFTDTMTGAAAGDFTATIHWGDGTTSAGTVSAGTNGGFVVTGTHTYTQTDDWGWGDPWHHGPRLGDSLRIVSVDIVDTKTQDEATTKSLATITPAASAVTFTTDNISATEDTPFTGVVAKITDPGATAGNLTATIDWGDGTSSQGTVTADSNGGFYVTGTHTYTFSDPFDGDGGGFGGPNAQALFSVTVQDTNTSATAFGLATISNGNSAGSSPGSTTSLNQLYVTELYQSLLGRLPDAGGLAYWSNLLNQGTSRSTIATQIEGSQEYRNDQVEALYEQMLHRQADPTGLTAFTTLLANGGTVEQVQALIAGSQEYFQTRGGGQASTFLQALYTDALNRGVDATGSAVFGQALANGVARQTIASIIFGSNEYHQDLIQGDYQAYLGRPADSGGLVTFMTGLQQGMTNQGMVAAMVGSQEYFAKM